MTEQTTASTTENVRLLASLMHSAKLAEARAHAALDAVGISVPKFQALKNLVEAGGSLSPGQPPGRASLREAHPPQLVGPLAGGGVGPRGCPAAARRRACAPRTP